MLDPFPSHMRKFMRIDEIDLVFLGTSSGAPSRSRNQQSLAMSLLGETWLFDCGEAAQHRMQLTTLTPPDVKRIFVSHLHGDHVFGLPGMLCAMSIAYDGGEGGGRSSAESHRNVRSREPIQIYGPQGLRAFLRAVLGNAYATLGEMKIQIHELVGLRAIERQGMVPHCSVSRPLPSEVPGETVEPGVDGLWRLPLGDDPPRLTIEAVELDHTVPTVGWVITETPRPGKLNADEIKPVLEQHGINKRMLKSFKLGIPIDLPDGTQLVPEDFMAPATQRKIAILSDMRAPKENAVFEPLLRDATLLVHEVPGVD